MDDDTSQTTERAWNLLLQRQMQARREFVSAYGKTLPKKWEDELHMAYTVLLKAMEASIYLEPDKNPFVRQFNQDFLRIERQEPDLRGYGRRN
jgi:hypothetical protein